MEEPVNRSPVSYSQVHDKYFVYYDAVRIGDEYFPRLTLERPRDHGEPERISVLVRDRGSFGSLDEARRAAAQIKVVDVDENGTVRLGSAEQA
jgi:hypothetical protein